MTGAYESKNKYKDLSIEFYITFNIVNCLLHANKVKVMMKTKTKCLIYFCPNLIHHLPKIKCFKHI
jgi:hypothetical protein